MNGAEGRTRTADTYIFSVVLYRLSYLGANRILATHEDGEQAPHHPWPVASGIAILAPMSTLLIASLQPGEGRTTTTTAALGWAASRNSIEVCHDGRRARLPFGLDPSRREMIG